MKNLVVLLVAALGFMTYQPVLAKTGHDDSTDLNMYRGYGNGFTFVERGITFAVYPDGEFDFYIDPRGVNANVNIGNVNISYNSGYNYDAYVQYDAYGAIIQIEDVPIYYDYYGRIVQAGNVRINYNDGRVVRIGGLRIYYDPYGYYSYSTGYINIYNRTYIYNPYFRYFTRPLYYRTVVSYMPYRKHYRPVRYRYTDYRRNYATNRNQYEKRSYKNIEGRIRSEHTDRNANSRVTVNNNRRTSVPQGNVGRSVNQNERRAVQQRSERTNVVRNNTSQRNSENVRSANTTRNVQRSQSGSTAQRNEVKRSNDKVNQRTARPATTVERPATRTKTVNRSATAPRVEKRETKKTGSSRNASHAADTRRSSNENSRNKRS